MIHFFDENISTEIPSKFTYPFQYIPHKITKIALCQLQSYLEKQTDFVGNFDVLGKMFGVLVVETETKELAYLRAFSGKINEMVHINGFVSPIVDTLGKNGFYKKGENELNNLTQEIIDYQNNPLYSQLKQKLFLTEQDFDIKLKKFKLEIKSKKKIRDEKRLEIKVLPMEKFLILEEELKNESIHMNYLFKDLKRDCKIIIDEIRNEILTFEKPLINLKNKRKLQSAKLQQTLHEKYNFLNATGDSKNLLDIFEEYPPAGSGECALPKLLNYAYQHKLKPIAMAEFWWGKSPSSDLKVHKQFYPSCKSKCKPILGFMLEGLEVDENPIKNRKNIHLDVIFEDDYIVVINKPHGFLSVDGAVIKDSVQSRMKNYLPKATGMLIVHRLDMATSGLLVIAKSSEVHKNLQQQFTNRTVKKRYVAILDGILANERGRIDLPIRPDYDNRPRQLVCFEHGKNSVTRYKVIERLGSKVKIHLFPETGRTHQLRVHCAYKNGLNMPITGDILYGTPSDRLYLHAERLEFIHPFTQNKVSFYCDSDFCLDEIVVD